MSFSLFKFSIEVLGLGVPYSNTGFTLQFFKLWNPYFRTSKFQLWKSQGTKNLVSKPTVIVGVLLQQFGQATIAGLLFLSIGPTTLGHTATVDHQKTFMAPLRATVQFLFAMLVSDTWQYLIHQCMHESKFLYKYTHSCYHRLVALYAYGALYNHPLEGLVVDTMSALSGAVSILASACLWGCRLFFFSRWPPSRQQTTTMECRFHGILSTYFNTS